MLPKDLLGYGLASEWDSAWGEFRNFSKFSSNKAIYGYYRYQLYTVP
jgi:hypothetical protein